MWDKVRRVLHGETDPGAGPRARRFEDQQIAVAALMVEAAELDGTFGDDERHRLTGLLRRHFELSPEHADALVDEATARVAESVEWQGFTKTVKDSFDHDGRIEVIEMLWEVAYADGVLHDYEASLLRRVAGLLYVTDRESGEARKRVLARLGHPS